MGRSGGRASADVVRQRRRRLAELIARRGTLTVDDIVGETGVSAMTAYRDIDALAEDGLVVRQQRGVVSAAASRLSEVSATLRLEQHGTEKAEMAVAAAALVRPGSSVLVDDSTSALWVLRELAGVPLTVVTNSLLVARELARAPGVRLLVTGGEYQPWAESLLGPTTIDMVAGVRADYCLLSASGISDDACFHPYEDVARVKRAMIASAQRPVLLLDHSKLERTALHRFAALTDFAVVVVDAGTPAAQVAHVRDLGVDVVVATARPEQ